MDSWLMDPNLRFNFPFNHTSFVVYYPKCNCRCFYCDLNKVFLGCIPFDEDTLSLSLPFIDCLVVSGGEPLLAFEDVLQFQKIAQDNDLWFYVYTNGFDTEKVEKLLNSYDKTKIVIDVKGSTIEHVNEVTKTKLGEKIWETYKRFNKHDRVIFRVNEYVKSMCKKFKHVEYYETIK